MKYILIGLGGFLGANCRYLVGGWAAERFGSTFPYGTLLVNVTGSFLIGLFLAITAERLVVAPNLRLLFAVGFLGAYTTFSTFSFESLALLEARAYTAATANVLGNLLLAGLAVTLGVVFGRAL
ncbi:MAG: fluoride efflux transporter CrcB [Dehalococcoidales bacterium]|nr:fluoride efflux transporter CrcB [Dehalococcoidales bacterium]